MTYALRPLYAILILALFACLAGRAAQKSGPLTYRLTVNPGDITLRAKPTTGSPAQLEETINFTVSNFSDTDYEGTAPSCQTFDVEIFAMNPPGEKSIWKWSQGQMFCEHVTSVIIPAGFDWHQTVKWDFAASDVKSGRYKVEATFVPSDEVASTEFEIQ